MKRKPTNLKHSDIQEILRLYPDTPAVEIAIMFGVHIKTIYNIAWRHEVKKSEAFMKSPAGGRIQKGQRLSPGTEFKKGMVPKTKGKKQDEYMSPDGIARSIDARFKKGQKPYTTLYDGAITVRTDKRGVKYKFIRQAESKWIPLHRHLWKQHHGDIPTGYNVVFKDGDTLNCAIDNLECISNAELATRNTIHRYPEEIKKAMRTLGKLNKVIKKNETH